LNNSTFTHGPENKDQPKKEKKPDKVLVQSPEAADAGKLRQVCFDMRDRGTCARGKDCKYVHDKAVVDEARKKALRDKKSAGNSQERTSKHSSYRDDQLLQEACPEWFSPHPLECLPRLRLVERYAPAKEEIEELLSSTGVIKIGSLGEVMWHAWLERDSREIWEHEGLCACGRRTRLFGQCMQCIAAEHAENVQARADQEAADQETLVEGRFKLEEAEEDKVASLSPVVEAGGLSNQLRNWLDSVCEGSVPMTQVRAEKNQKAGGKSTDQTARLSQSETQS